MIERLITLAVLAAFALAMTGCAGTQLPVWN